MSYKSVVALGAGVLLLAACDAQDSALTEPGAGVATNQVAQSAGFRTSAPAQAAIQVPGELVPIATAGDAARVQISEKETTYAS